MPALALLATAVYSSIQSDLKISPKYDDSVVEVALIDPQELLPLPSEPEPELMPEPEIMPEPEEEPIVELPKPPEPKPEPPKPVPPKPASPKPQPPKPQVAKPAPTPLTPPAPQPIAKVPETRTVAQPAPPAPRIDTAALESRYVNGLRAELEKYKQYPRGREASLQRPVGNVVVWLLVDRSGKVLDSGIETKASNMLLNRAAQTSLRRIEKVSPFPSDVFSGKDKYRFTATLVYNIEEK